MRKQLPLFLVLALAMPVLAQEFVPTIVVSRDGKAEPLGLVELSYDVRIFGYFAETSATMTFGNSQLRQTEGDLYFPLPEGATVSGFALDVQGKMVDGVAVEKERATNAFETEKARRVDPGLVEWTRRDHFHTRVFPIPAGGQRIVRVQYVHELPGGPGGVTYCLPLGFTRPIPRFSVRVEVIKPAGEPKIRQGAMANFQFGRWRDSVVAETKLENALPGKELVIALPDVERQPVQVEQAEDGSVYFAVHDLPPTRPADARPSPPKHVVIYWDASGSRATDDHGREVGLLRTILSEWSSSFKRPLEVDLVLLRNVLACPQRFQVAKDADWTRLSKTLARVDYDGATQLGAIRPIAGERPDLALLFSDGVSTFGRCEPPPLGVPLFVFSSDANSDWAVLNHLAASNGGQCFDLAQAGDAEIVAAMARLAWRPVPATVAGGRISALLPGTSGTITPDHVTLVGRLDSPQAALTLRYRTAGQNDIERTFTIDGAEATSGSLLRRLWAQRKLNELLVQQQRHQPEIVALGKEFGLVTPYTSLIVLESLQQYVQHGIEPPKSLPEMRNAYLRQTGGTTHSDTTAYSALQDWQFSAKKAEVGRLWQERVKWWATDVRRSSKVAKIEAAKPVLRPVVVFGPEASGFGSPFPRRAQAAGMGGVAGGSTAGMGGLGGMGMGMAGGAGGGMMGGMGGQGGGSTAGGGMAFGGNAHRGGGSSGAMGGMLNASSLPAGDSSLPQDAGVQFSVKAFRHRQPAQIALMPHDKYAAYLADLHASASGRQAFAVYMKHRRRYARSPDFFFDCAEYFFGEHETEMAIQVLSNLAELEPSDPKLYRHLAHRLMEAAAYDLAIETFEQIVTVQPNEPQAYRDLALALAQRADLLRSTTKSGRKPRREPADPDAAPADESVETKIRKDYARAVELLKKIVVDRWDGRFAEIELPVLLDLNCILVRARQYGVRLRDFDPRFVRLLDLDLRIVVSWPSDNPGIGVLVTEPSGETASFDRGPTRIGGLVSRGSAGGGLEEYLVRRAMNGQYLIQAVSGSPDNPIGPTTFYVDIFINFGRGKEQQRSFTVRLEDKADKVTLGKVRI